MVCKYKRVELVLDERCLLTGHFRYLYTLQCYCNLECPWRDREAKGIVKERKGVGGYVKKKQGIQPSSRRKPEPQIKKVLETIKNWEPKKREGSAAPTADGEMQLDAQLVIDRSTVLTPRTGPRVSQVPIRGYRPVAAIKTKPTGQR